MQVAHRPGSATRAPVSREARWLGACWLVVALVPSHNFVARPNAQAVSQVGLEPILEIAYFGAVGLLALAVVLDREPGSRARPPIALFSLPAWVICSAAWSPTAPYAVVRGAELAVIATLAWATLAVARTSLDDLRELVAVFLRWLPRVTLVLVALGVVLGPVLVPASEENRERFTWVGAHPNGSGLILALAVLTLVAAAPATLRLATATRAASAAVLLAALVANHSRTAWVCLAVGLGVSALVVLRRRRSSWTGAVATLALVAVPVVAVAAGPAWSYFARGQSRSSLATGNGRLDLWSIGFDALQGPFDWLCGLGYGSARTVFVAEEAWARTAHNSVLSLLVSVGIVGVVLLLVCIAGAVNDLWRGRVAVVERDGLALCGLLAVLCANGLATDALAEPNVGFAGLSLVAAAAYGFRWYRVSPRSRP